MFTWILVITRIVVNPVSNVFQKRLAHEAADPLFIIGATHGILTVACIPLLFFPLPITAPVSFCVNIVIVALLAVAGNALLVHALRSTDLSILGPVNAYKPVISLILAVVLIGEVPTATGLLGVLLILAGSYVIVDRDVHEPRRNALVQFFRARGVQLRFAALALSATEAVFLKKALLVSSPLTTFVLWSILGLPISAVGLALIHRRQLSQEVRLLLVHFRTYLWLALTTGVMQLTTIFTFGKLPVGYSLALFQMSAIISVFLGYRYFQERNIRKRLLGSLVMVGGAVLIVMS
jgi:drug/metabolite transporter (DMT)-like permease